MERKYKIIMTAMTFVIVLQCIPISINLYEMFYGKRTEKEQLEEITRQHLYEKGYTDKDIKKIKGMYSLKNKNTYREYIAKVTFQDEPNVTYYYYQTSIVKQEDNGIREKHDET